MTKFKTTREVATLPQVDNVRELTPAELDSVAGGYFSFSNSQTNSFANAQNEAHFSAGSGYFSGNFQVGDF